MPCTARQPIRVSTEPAIPAPIEPTMKITMASWTSRFLLTRSDSLPQTGVLTVVASRVAVTTQV